MDLLPALLFILSLVGSIFVAATARKRRPRGRYAANRWALCAALLVLSASPFIAYALIPVDPDVRYFYKTCIPVGVTLILGCVSVAVIQLFRPAAPTARFS